MMTIFDLNGYYLNLTLIVQLKHNIRVLDVLGDLTKTVDRSTRQSRKIIIVNKSTTDCVSSGSLNSYFY